MNSMSPSLARSHPAMSKRASADGDGAPSPIDVHVGARIRLRRTALGMSQEKLGEALKLTFQQIQKYERGVNRVGASRLYDLCRVFRVSADYFFEGLPSFGSDMRRPAGGFAVAETQAGLADDLPEPSRPPLTAEEAELLACFSGVSDPDVRRRILDLVKSLSATSS